MDYKQTVYHLKVNDNDDKDNEKEIMNAPTLTEKCVCARRLLGPQSSIMENIIKDDLQLEKKRNNTSGDATKDGKNYEIKFSGHAKKSKWNFVQIRPDHDIQLYVLIGYNMYDKSEPDLGKGYIFKIPATEMYKLVIKYGGYAHGTIKKLGKITNDNFKGRNCEYALRCDPNSETSKNTEVFKELLKYEVEYSPLSF